MCVSIVGFAFLQFHPWAIAAAEPSEDESVDVDAQHASLDAHIQASIGANTEPEGDAEHASLVRNGCWPCPATAAETASTGDQLVAIVKKEQSEKLSQRAIFKLTWQFLACQYVLAAFSFGVLPSVMPYVYKKYAVRPYCQITIVLSCASCISLGALVRPAREQPGGRDVSLPDDVEHRRADPRPHRSDYDKASKRFV
jgi:hypothetical protein